MIRKFFSVVLMVLVAAPVLAEDLGRPLPEPEIISLFAIGFVGLFLSRVKK